MKEMTTTTVQKKMPEAGEIHECWLDETYVWDSICSQRFFFCGHETLKHRDMFLVLETVMAQTLPRTSATDHGVWIKALTLGECATVMWAYFSDPNNVPTRRIA